MVPCNEKIDGSRSQGGWHTLSAAAAASSGGDAYESAIVGPPSPPASAAAAPTPRARHERSSGRFPVPGSTTRSGGIGADEEDDGDEDDAVTTTWGASVSYRKPSYARPTGGVGGDASEGATRSQASDLQEASGGGGGGRRWHDLPNCRTALAVAFLPFK
jgi:hypothetical protein